MTRKNTKIIFKDDAGNDEKLIDFDLTGFDQIANITYILKRK